MTSASRRLLFLAILTAMPLSANAARKSAQVKPNNSIIPLPLNPIVPASQRVCAARTPTGLGYTILRAAAGAKPTERDVVLVNYLGYLATTGAVFDQGMRSPLPVSGVIPGFSQGLQMMAKGSVMRFCIPAALGYGARATGPIPANADLVFQVETIDFRPAATAPDTAEDAAPKP